MRKLNYANSNYAQVELRKSGIKRKWNYALVELCISRIMRSWDYAQVELCASGIMLKSNYAQVGLCRSWIMRKWNYVKIELCAIRIMCTSNYARVGIDYTYGQLDMYIKNSPVEIQIPAHWNLIGWCMTTLPPVLSPSSILGGNIYIYVTVLCRSMILQFINYIKRRTYGWTLTSWSRRETQFPVAARSKA